MGVWTGSTISMVAASSILAVTAVAGVVHRARSRDTRSEPAEETHEPLDR
ncbi:hypothetical protein [Rhodococcus sp. NPDC059234]